MTCHGILLKVLLNFFQKIVGVWGETPICIYLLTQDVIGYKIVFNLIFRLMVPVFQQENREEG